MPQNLRTLVEEQAELHQVFSNPCRLMILWALEAREMSVGEIAEMIGATLQNTSQHLRIMKDKGIVEAHREGQIVYYQISSSEIGNNCKLMLHVFNHQFQTYK